MRLIEKSQHFVSNKLTVKDECKRELLRTKFPEHISCPNCRHDMFYLKNEDGECKWEGEGVYVKKVRYICPICKDRDTRGVFKEYRYED